MNSWHPERDQAGAAAAFAATTALIVDDEAHVRSYLRLVLRTLGVITMWEAADGREALELYEAHRPTVVLLDVSMPVMGGDEMMRKLTAIDPDAVVIVVTSQNDYEIVKRFVRLGATSYVLKHLPREEIAEMIADVLLRLGQGAEEEA